MCTNFRKDLVANIFATKIILVIAYHIERKALMKKMGY